MERIAVDSTNLESVGYDSQSLVLEIEFKRGGIYQYYDVPEYLYVELMGAGSKGTFLNENIKSTYNYSQV